MASFTGTYYYTLDPKGRTVIPAPLREVLSSKYGSNKLYITNAALDKCLHIFPEAEWNLLEEKVKTLPSSDQAIQFYKRRVFSAAVACETDKNGRIMVPYELRQNAGIKNDIVVVGLVDKLELWDKQRWDDLTDLDKVDIESFAKKLSEYGI
ncbi:MAG TPA: division/cell wall cluster transcriptional repressor MraZ [Dissulfurispiraceae bacterium]|nr:division/cell wall cluster transcriptional repressor MraZ [Dissulfurispiraceae bacterium]